MRFTFIKAFVLTFREKIEGHTMDSEILDKKLL